MPEELRKVAAVAAFVFIASLQQAGAQTVPGGATPGGALPDLQDSRRLSPAATSTPIPSVLDRLEQDVEDGPQIAVRKFTVFANRNAETAWRKGRYLVEVEELLAEALAGQPENGFSVGQITRITRKIEDWLRQEGMILAQVFIPVQQVTDGDVAIEVMEGRVGEIVAQGNDRYKTPVLSKPLNSLTGRAVDSRSVERSVLLLRDYPGIAVAGVFSPGNERGSTDLTLRVQDEDPLDVRLSVDNYGSRFTGETRTLAVVDWNSPLGRADKLTLSGLKTWDPDNGNYAAANYRIPFFSPGVYLDFGYVQNTFDVASSGSLFDTGIEGDTTVASIGLISKIMRGRVGNLTSNVSLLSKRATVRDTLNDLVQARDKLTVLDVSVDFDFVDTRFRGINTGVIGFTKGFADLLGSLDEGDPNVNLGSSRQNSVGTFAGGKFEKWYGQFSRLQQLTQNSELLLRTNMQVSDDLIVSLEQFALGGPNSVRAYPPAEFLVDTGGYASIEWILAAPGFANREAFGGYNWGDMLRFSVYYDYAGGYLSETAFGEQKTRDLHGYGIGIDFRLPGRFWSRLDIAKPRGSEVPSDRDDPQFYFTVNLSF